MKLLHWLPCLRTSALSIALAIVIVGMCQFAFSDIREPFYCIGIASPWKRLLYYFEAGGKVEMTAQFTSREITRFIVTALLIMIFTGLLCWSIYAQRPFRFRMSLRASMLAVAIVPIAWLGGKEVWSGWHRVDDYWKEVEKRRSNERHWKEIEQRRLSEPIEVTLPPTWEELEQRRLNEPIEVTLPPTR
jgi:hypothetical protein